MKQGKETEANYPKRLQLGVTIKTDVPDSFPTWNDKERLAYLYDAISSEETADILSYVYLAEETGLEDGEFKKGTRNVGQNTS